MQVSQGKTALKHCLHKPFLTFYFNVGETTLQKALLSTAQAGLSLFSEATQSLCLPHSTDGMTPG